LDRDDTKTLKKIAIKKVTKVEKKEANKMYPAGRPFFFLPELSDILLIHPFPAFFYVA